MNSPPMQDWRVVIASVSAEKLCRRSLLSRSRQPGSRGMSKALVIGPLSTARSPEEEPAQPHLYRAVGPAERSALCSLGRALTRRSESILRPCAESKTRSARYSCGAPPLRSGTPCARMRERHWLPSLPTCRKRQVRLNQCGSIFSGRCMMSYRKWLDPLIARQKSWGTYIERTCKSWSASWKTAEPTHGTGRDFTRPNSRVLAAHYTDQSFHRRSGIELRFVNLRQLVVGRCR